MFSRVQFEDGTNIIALVAFAICFCVFVVFLVKAFRMSKHQVNDMANLPLQDDTTPNSDPCPHHEQK